MIKSKKKKLPVITEVLISDILPPKENLRRYFEMTKLDGLSRSIKRYGVLQPVLLRRLGKKYEMISGERRLRAASLAGFRKIPAIITELNDCDAAAVSLIENIHREELSFLDECDGLLRLAESKCLNISNLSYMLSVSDSAIEEKLRFVKLPKSVKKAIAYNKIPEKQAKQLLRLGSEETALKAISKISENGYDTSQTRELVDKILMNEMPVLQAAKKYNGGDIRILKNTLNKTVDIMKRSGMKAKTTERDKADCYEYTIRVEKAR